MTIAPVSHSPLTTSDITRLPSSAMLNQQGSIPETTPDEYVPQKKSSKLKKLLFGAVAIAAAAVLVKKFKPNWLNIDVANPKWTDHIKKWTGKVADWAEWPFIKIKDMFAKKAN